MCSAWEPYLRCQIPELADVIVPSAAEVLNELGPRLREVIRTRRTDEMVDVQSLAIELLTLEVMLLKIEPGIEDAHPA